MGNHSLFDWVSVLGPILLSWPLLAVVVLLFFYKPLFKLLEKVSGQDIQKAKIGPIEIEEAEQSYLEALKLLLESFITEDELHQMQQLNNPETTVPYDSTRAFTRGLRHLHTVGFISVKTELDALPQQGNLKPLVELTGKGQKYLSLRENLLNKQDDSSS